MTRVAILSDVHADVHAVRDALAQIDRIGCDVILCAGDLIDYGVFPDETIGLLNARGVPCIRGNHDRWAVGRLDAAHDASGWDLTPGTLLFLAGLPTTWASTIDGVRVALHHGSPRSDMEGIYPDTITADDAARWLREARADVLLVGHTHLAFAIELFGGGLIANPGALLREPAGEREDPWLYDPDAQTFVRAPAAGGGTFGVLELPGRRFTVHLAVDGQEVTIPRPVLGVRDRREPI